jgi:O-antigen/teichoic acid export membrane protein
VSKDQSPTLSERTAKAGLWTVGGKLFAKGLDFISLLILARFLGATEFGVVAMAMTAVQVVEALSEMPLSAVLLNYQKPTAVMYDTAFTIAILRAIVILVVLSALSWPLSLLYHEPRLIALQCALALAPAMRGLVSQRLVEFARVMDFRRDVALDVMAKAGSLVIATTLAITTHSYWAIAVGTISTTAIMMIASYFFAPQRIRLNLSQWPIFTDMVGWNAAGQVLSALNWQTDKIILPRFVDTATFGRFTSADNLIGIPVQAIILPITRPLFSAFIAVRESDGLGRVYLKACAGIFSLVGLLLLMIAMLSQPIIHLILGSKWAPTAPILTWLAFAGIIALPAVLLPALAMALNRTRVSFIRLMVEFCIKIPLIITLAMTMQLQGVLIGQAISSCVVLMTTMVLVKDLAGLTVTAQLRGLFRPVAAMLPTGFFLFEASKIFSAVDTELFIFLNLSWVCATALMIFAVTNVTLWKLVGSPEACESFAFRMAGRIFQKALKR